MSMLRRGQGHGQARATATEIHTHAHTHIYMWKLTCTVPISSRMSELGPRKGHYFHYMEAYKHRRKIYTYKHTHAGMTLSVTSSSVYCGSVTCMLLTSSSFVFISLYFSANWYFFKMPSCKFKAEKSLLMLLNCSKNTTL